MEIVLVVENVTVSAAFTYDDGVPALSSLQDGVPETAGPPAFTRTSTDAASAGPPSENVEIARRKQSL